jgi:hypothetical protein
MAAIPELVNFAIGTVSGTFTAVSTTINLSAGHGNRFPIPVPFDVVIWNGAGGDHPGRR